MEEVREQLERIRELALDNPEAFKKALADNPRARELLEELSARYGAAESVSVKGFNTFYRGIYNRALPEPDIPIVEAFVNAFHTETGVIEECWRGFGKSTLLIAWAAYVIGARPVGSTALVRINDTKAKEAGDTIAEIIEKNPGWKKIFPHVIPDKVAGWSVERGYHVKDTRICGNNDEGYEHWLQLCFADHVSEPSLATGGVQSGIIIGMHPTNGMWFDDLHDEDNTRSAGEMQKVIDILDGNIIPTWFGVAGSPALGVACTPWSEKDAYVRMMQTGLFEKVTLPIFVKQIPEVHPAKWIWEKSLKEHGWKRFEPYGTDVILTWPDAFPIERVMKMYDAGPARFGQMYLLDLTTLKGLTLLREWLGEYPGEKISETWPTYFGIDFASTTDKLRVGDTDYFALAMGKAIPSGGIVTFGGFRGRLSMNESIAKVQALANLYNPVAIGVEKFGAGRQYIEQLIHATKLPIVPLPAQGAPVKSKGERYENVLAPDFSIGRMWISDVRDDFLNAFVDEWISWDGGLARSRTGHDDTLDATYYLREIALGHVMKMRAAGVGSTERVGTPFATAGAYYRRNKK